MKRLAIIGASYLQVPLIIKAKELEVETHVFAWGKNEPGEKCADFFYPISIIDKETILRECKKIGISGICSIASDLASITVNYVACAMGLVGNSIECTMMSTNKYMMRQAFEKNGDPSPKSYLVSDGICLKNKSLKFPIIVKPTDRSGSRGITKLKTEENLEYAIQIAKEQGFEKKVLVEEYVYGEEYSIECISWRGKHSFIAMTKKYTTGAPHFIEMAHLQPALVSPEILNKVKRIVFHALDSLKIEFGASHTEIKIDKAGSINLIEIGGRMGGDLIGSKLVELSTGIDFVRAVIQIALSEKPNLDPIKETSAAAVRYIFSEKDMNVLGKIKLEHPEVLVSADIQEVGNGKVTDSSNRYGYFLLESKDVRDLLEYMPNQMED
ncbi:ATP-grasp domain-containing protein [Diplocloster hominis]|uniref:ATP-grasp domain-containing protein n=1 Tax=Diplocloster hominis TaxID=3079010 RepID=UPI0031BBC639